MTLNTFASVRHVPWGDSSLIPRHLAVSGASSQDYTAISFVWHLKILRAKNHLRVALWAGTEGYQITILLLLVITFSAGGSATIPCAKYVVLVHHIGLWNSSCWPSAHFPCPSSRGCTHLPPTYVVQYISKGVASQLVQCFTVSSQCFTPVFHWNIKLTGSLNPPGTFIKSLNSFSSQKLIWAF